MCSRYMRLCYLVSTKCNNINLPRRSYVQSRLRLLSQFSTSPNFSISDQSRVNEKGPPSEETILSENEQVSEKEKEILEKNQQLLERLNEIEDKYKRSLAENENIRTRMRREIADAKQYGIQSFVKDLVEVSDVLSKATSSVPEEAITDDNPHLKHLFEGLKMTEAQLQTVFRRYGVTNVNPVGEKFDPNLHEALFEQEDPSKEPGTVGLVTKIGYKLHDRIIRPALVGVVKSAR